MNLLERLQNDLKAAMLARDAMQMSVLRMLLTRIKEKQVEQGVDSPLDDEAIQQVLASFAKQRRDAAEAFEQAGRTDVRDKELQEREIVMRYLPEPLDDAAVRAVLQEIVAETGASTPGDLGRVMGAAMKRLRGRVDGARVQALAREILGG